jgi:hypothetical protein
MFQTSNQDSKCISIPTISRWPLTNKVLSISIELTVVLIFQIEIGKKKEDSLEV